MNIDTNQTTVPSAYNYAEGVCCDIDNDEWLLSNAEQRVAKTPDRQRPPFIKVPKVPDTPKARRILSEKNVIRLEDINQEIGIAFGRMQQASRDNNKNAIKVYTRQFDVLMSARAALFNVPEKKPEWHFEYFNPV